MTRLFSSSRFQVALASFAVLVATLGLAGLLAGCASHGRAPVGVGGWGEVTATAAAVSSSGLGYESTYPQAGVELAGGSRAAWRVAATAAQSQKLETGDGYGLRGELVAGPRFGDLALVAGPVWTHQETSAWSKSATFARLELDWTPRGHELRLWHDWRTESVEDLPGGQVERAAGLAWRSPGRLAFDAGAERVWFLSWGEPFPPGSRYHLGVAYRFGGR